MWHSAFMAKTYFIKCFAYLYIFFCLSLDIITDIIGIWSVFFEFYLFLMDFVTMEEGRLTSDDHSLIWNLRKTLTVYKVV